MTNKIQEQLTERAVSEIRALSDDVAVLIRDFVKESTHTVYNGMDWEVGTVKGEWPNDYKTQYKFLQWAGISELVESNITEAFLEAIVVQKTKTLMAKLDLI
jgi:hypothetical protein